MNRISSTASRRGSVTTLCATCTFLPSTRAGRTSAESWLPRRLCRPAVDGPSSKSPLPLHRRILLTSRRSFLPPRRPPVLVVAAHRPPQQQVAPIEALHP